MKELIFLKKLKQKCIIELVEPSEEMKLSYYVETQQIIKVTKESCNEMIIKAEDFLVKMKLLISELNNEKINSTRNSFISLIS